MNGRVVDLFQARPNADEWGDSPAISAVIRAVGAERGYAPDFIARQRERVLHLLRLHYGYGGPTITMPLKTIEGLPEWRRQAIALEVQDMLNVQGTPTIETATRVLIEALEVAFPLP